MYNNVGKTIKGFSIAIMLIESIFSLIVGVMIMTEEDITIGTIVMFGGIFIALVFTILMYGLGTLVENSDNTKFKVYEIEKLLKENNDICKKLNLANIEKNDTSASSQNIAEKKKLIINNNKFDAEEYLNYRRQKMNNTNISNTEKTESFKVSTTDNKLINQSKDEEYNINLRKNNNIQEETKEREIIEDSTNDYDLNESGLEAIIRIGKITTDNIGNKMVHMSLSLMKDEEYETKKLDFLRISGSFTDQFDLSYSDRGDYTFSSKFAYKVFNNTECSFIVCISNKIINRTDEIKEFFIKNLVLKFEGSDKEIVIDSKHINVENE